MFLKKTFHLITIILVIHITSAYSQSYGGYTLYSPMQGSSASNAYLIDSAGNLEHQWSNLNNCNYSTYLLNNGNILRGAKASGTSLSGGASGGLIEEINWNGDVVWSFEYNSSQYLLHHDFTSMPNGNILAIAWEVKSASEVSAAGFSMAQEKYMDHIIEIEPSGSNGGNIVWEWHVWDHLTTDGENHPELFSVEMGVSSGPFGGGDWMHTNGISYNPDKDLIVISSHNFDEVYVIDHSTTKEEAASHSGGNYGKGGDIIYRWGNTENFTNNGSTTLDVVHNASWIPTGYPGAGNIMAFNNQERSGASIITEINPYNNSDEFDISNQPDPAWTYSNGQNFYSTHLGTCQRLPNGNTFIVESTNDGYMFEVNSDGDIVWTYDGANTEVARGQRYGADHPGIVANLGGTPIIDKNTLSINNQIKLNSFPNPFTKYTEISFDNQNKSAELSIFNMNGKKVIHRVIKDNSFRWDATNFKSGLYIAKIKIGNKVFTRNLNLIK